MYGRQSVWWEINNKPLRAQAHDAGVDFRSDNRMFIHDARDGGGTERLQAINLQD